MQSSRFAKKYDYLCKHPYLPAIVHTDHKPLTHFLKSDLHERTYGHWADILRRLNLTIQYIPGPRNKVADGLSRTLFHASDCAESPAIARVSELLSEQGPKWIWKDGKDGVESFLKSLDQVGVQEVVDQGTLHGVSAFTLEAINSAGPPDAQATIW